MEKNLFYVNEKARSVARWDKRKIMKATWAFRRSHSQRAQGLDVGAEDTDSHWKPSERGQSGRSLHQTKR